jgi:hypothetical protein
MGKIKPKERDAIIMSLSVGLVPKIGLQHILVGRDDEIAAIVTDLERIKDDGTAIRFIIGRYGSGKSFFLTLSRIVALDKKFVVAHADITQGHLLYSTQGKARALYSELMHNLSVKSRPDGGALRSIIEHYISDVDYKLRSEGKDNKQILSYIHDDLKEDLQNYVSGYDFELVLCKYFEGYESGNDILMDAALRWLYGEYPTKTEAKRDLNVHTIIDDSNYYNYLKLWARFVRKAGYSGFLVTFDEMVAISNHLMVAQSRNSNYKTILDILNDCIQGGNTSGIGFVFAGTDEFLNDSHRGIASYPALDCKLRENPLEKMIAPDLKNFRSPVIKLENFSPADTYLLLENIRDVFANGDTEKYLIPDAGMKAFLTMGSKILGSDVYMDPRETVQSFVKFLSLLETHPDTSWKKMLMQNSSIIEKKPDGVLANLKL